MLWLTCCINHTMPFSCSFYINGSLYQCYRSHFNDMALQNFQSHNAISLFAILCMDHLLHPQVVACIISLGKFCAMFTNCSKYHSIKPLAGTPNISIKYTQVSRSKNCTLLQANLIYSVLRKVFTNRLL